MPNYQLFWRNKEGPLNPLGFVEGQVFEKECDAIVAIVLGRIPKETEEKELILWDFEQKRVVDDFWEKVSVANREYLNEVLVAITGWAQNYREAFEVNYGD